MEPDNESGWTETGPLAFVTATGPEGAALPSCYGTTNIYGVGVAEDEGIPEIPPTHFWDGR